MGTGKTVVKLGLLALAGVILVNSGLLSSITQQLRIRELIGQFRKQEEQEFMMKVEDAAAASAPVPDIVPGGL